MGKKKRVNRPNQDITFLFDRNDEIGAADAEQDGDYLAECFVDTGDIRIISDLSDRRQIVLGRTGAGKSALLSELLRDTREHAIQISPEGLALTYVSNSNLLQFFSELGVNLDPFFKLLWRHVLTVEVLLHHFSDQLSKGPKGRSLFEVIGGFLTGDNRKRREVQKSLDYLETWGRTFWEDTEFRVKEITERVEEELSAKLASELGLPIAKIKSELGSTSKLSQERKSELRQLGQRVIAQTQVQDLLNVIKVLDNVLEDRQKYYYIVIDGLDENWVEETLRYRLIMALINTSRDFSGVKNAKIVIALRRDLIERVFRVTRDSGFQEEKYESMYLPLKWAKKDLLRLLNLRVERMVKGKTGRPGFGYRQLLPSKADGMDIDEYLYQRASRPRDIIAFFAACIAEAVGESSVGRTQLQHAEGKYSRLRLRALASEWSGDYPLLLEMTRLLHKRPASCKLESFKDKEIEEFCLSVATANDPKVCPFSSVCHRVAEETLEPQEGMAQIVYVFYKVGLVGLKTKSFEKPSWVDELGRGVAQADIGYGTSIVVHPTFQKALGTRK